MILYIFNHYYPDHGGFAKRCAKEIEMLSTKYEIVVLCRGKRNEVEKEIKIKSKNIKFFYFHPFFSINNKIANYNSNFAGIYEILRNLGLILGLGKELISVLNKYKYKKSIQIYSVVSPLTIPLIAFVISRFFGAIPRVVEFHDLEPEMAIHIKKLTDKSIILKIEYLLEKLCSNIYKSIIVTSNSQARCIVTRTGISKDKILVMPNSIQVEPSKNADTKTNNKEFLVGYVSSLSYDYTVNGLFKIIDTFADRKNKLSNIKFLIVGDGILLPEIKKRVKNRGLNDKFIFTGKVSNVSELVKTFDLAIIPWEKNIMSDIILPTKLFEYMAMKKTVIAPAFGEFKEIIIPGKNGFLYNDVDDLVSKLMTLYKNKSTRLKVGTMAYNTYTTKFNPETLEAKYLIFLNKYDQTVHSH